MLCSKCGKREATVYISQTVNGVKNEIRLCSQCAEAQGGYSMFNMTDNPFSGFFGESIFSSPARNEQKKCSFCGQSARELAKSGRAGCAKCYEVFEAELGKMIHGIHGGAVHSGSLPGKHAEDVKKQKRISELREEQRQAIAEQNYERAAELRDMIKKIEDGEDE